ncbi:MAG: tetratricopeptide repeat protein [Acidobacteriota bacterium]
MRPPRFLGFRRVVPWLWLAALAVGCGGPTEDGPRTPQAGFAPSPPSVPAPAGLAGADRSVRDQYAQVRADFELSLAEADGSEDPRAARGRAYGQLGLWYQAYRFDTGAVTAFEIASELDPRAPRWAYHLATLHRLRGRGEEALEHYRRVIEATEPAPYPPALAWTGAIHLDHHRLREAETAYGRALDQNGGMTVALHGLAKVALAEGRSGDARPLLERALDLEPDAAPLLYALARSHLADGNGRLAEALLERLPDDNRRHGSLRLADPWLHEVDALATGVQDHLRAGLRARRAGDLALALERFQRAVAADASNLEASLQLSQLLVELRRPRKAQERLADVKTTFPGEPRVLVLEARAALMLGDVGGAELAVERALEADPSSVAARGLRAEILLRSGRSKEALDLLAGLRSQHPGDPAVARAHATALISVGRSAEARGALEQDLERMPDQPALQTLLDSLGNDGSEAIDDVGNP